jgi:hypothetical protein
MSTPNFDIPSLNNKKFFNASQSGAFGALGFDVLDYDELQVTSVLDYGQKEVAWIAIKAIRPAAITIKGVHTGDLFSSGYQFDLQRGETLFGDFYWIEIESGAVLAYRAFAYEGQFPIQNTGP